MTMVEKFAKEEKEGGAREGRRIRVEGRPVAEQLLNPCDAAIQASNLSRVQHLLYVIRELASPSGDVNHRLAEHGLRTLTRYLVSAGLGAAIPSAAAADAASLPQSFQTTEPKPFRSALIKFHEVSPWFALPNALANASILQALAIDPPRARSLHVVDIGVSHGIQWPTLLEELTRRPGGAPSAVRLTVAGPSAAPPCPFASSPPAYDFPSHLLRYAKSIDLNLQIHHAADLRAVDRSADEILVVSSQFRARYGAADDRSTFLRSIRGIDPDLLILTEIDAPSTAAGFLDAFARGAEVLWRFLDSTSAAFKRRDCPERRMVEGEAARVLDEETAMKAAAEGRKGWWEAMVALGFREEAFGEEAADAGRALLRKYDGNWELRTGEPALCLAWKGQPVSFCSLWRPAWKRAPVRSRG